MQTGWYATAAIFIATLAGTPIVCAQTDQQHRVVRPGDLKWKDLPSLPQGAKVAVIEGDPSKEGFTTIRVKLPPNYKVPAHYHGTVERSTIIAGTLYIGMGEKFDDKKMTPMPAGTVLLMPPQMPHFASTKGDVIFQLNVQGPWTVTYINPADDPRTK
jgi:quercetin dioxygenase-like cupin family protein